MGGLCHAPAALPRGMIRYPMRRRLSGPLGRSERVRKILPTPEFDTRTFQPVASTDYAVPYTHTHTYIYIYVYESDLSEHREKYTQCHLTVGDTVCVI